MYSRQLNFTLHPYFTSRNSPSWAQRGQVQMRNYFSILAPCPIEWGSMSRWWQTAKSPQHTHTLHVTRVPDLGKNRTFSQPKKCLYLSMNISRPFDLGRRPLGWIKHGRYIPAQAFRRFLFGLKLAQIVTIIKTWIYVSWLDLVCFHQSKARNKGHVNQNV